MIIIENTLVSEDVIERNFICDIEKCKGACCIEGDAGAPLNDDELLIIESQFENIKPYLSDDALNDIEQRGFYEKIVFFYPCSFIRPGYASANRHSCRSDCPARKKRLCRMPQSG
jgi:hypothetical protein